MAVQVYLDGIELDVPVIGGIYALTGSVTRRLNRPSLATINVPMEYAIGDAGSRLRIDIDGDIWFHGFVLVCETDTGEDEGKTTYNAQDPLEMWQWRVVRDADGDFSKPTIIEDFVSGPQIIQAMMANSEDAGDIPSFAEGPLFLAPGSFAGGGVDLTGAPTDWPMTMAEVASLLISTGEVDIVITPIDSGGNMGSISVYNGNYGTDRTGSVIFEYGMGQRNIRELRWNKDMTNLINKLWYYLGPRVKTPEDPGSEQHWRANITGDDTLLPNPPGGDVNPYPNANTGPLGERIQNSRNTYGVRMQVQIFDARGDEATVGRMLYRRLWQVESWLRAEPRELVHITPRRGVEIGTFDIGDLVTVRASSAVRGGFDGEQRIYEYTVAWDEDGVLALSDFQTSPSMEGL